ncbi:MAG TPA: hypothetical protein PKY87_07380, partial [Terricaulis sp.]|nr:hypothetical protein [Terricaulis sp.]
MRQSLDLYARAEAGVDASRGALGQWRSVEQTARFALEAGGGAAVSLGAGAYVFALCLIAEG